MTDYLKALAKKGRVTISERPGKKTSVRLDPFSVNGAITLTGWASADQLLLELSQMCENYPDKP
jgi:hypothetical protein